MFSEKQTKEKRKHQRESFHLKLNIFSNDLLYRFFIKMPFQSLDISSFVEKKLMEMHWNVSDQLPGVF